MSGGHGMDWDADVSKAARDWMAELGSFGPTVNAKDGVVKGWMLDVDGDHCKTYFTTDDLRGLAAACNEVADWLDNRKRLTPPEAE